MPAERHSFRARWVIPVASAPIENGIVEVEGSRISAVHGRHDPDATDLGNVALIPGLVNAHTHLEFSELEQPLDPPKPFTLWIGSLVEHRRTRRQPVVESLSQGLIQSRTNGTTTVGEIATVDWPADLPDSLGPRTVVFRELLGRLPESVTLQLEVANTHLRNRPADQSRAIFGLSPHAPYSVHPELFERIIDLAVSQQAPVAFHLAETRSELEFLARGTGEFTRMLQSFGVWRDGVALRNVRPLDYLRPMSKLDHGLVVHGNYLDAEEIEFLAQHPNLTVVYCPRTHAFFGHTPHPWQQMLASGVRVALGTDSRASNPNLSIWEELQFLRNLAPDFDPLRLLQLGTLDGATALGLEAETGTLEAGKSADIAIVALSDEPGEAWQLLFSSASRVSGTMIRGRWC